MKKFLQKVWRVIRLIFGVELALAALGGVIVSIQSPEVGNIVLTIVCAGVAYLLFRKKNTQNPEQTKADPNSVNTGDE